MGHSKVIQEDVCGLSNPDNTDCEARTTKKDTQIDWRWKPIVYSTKHNFPMLPEPFLTQICLGGPDLRVKFKKWEVSSLGEFSIPKSRK
jgi:hypothetical protein